MISHPTPIRGFSSNDDSLRLIIVMPVFNDWESVQLLIPRLSEALDRAGLSARLLLVDDGSTAHCPEEILVLVSRALDPIEILHLCRNVGHQRAIAVGLCYINDHIEGDAVVVMDADGEDRPEDIPLLADEFVRHRKVVFAERTRRSEGMVFRLFYTFYRWMHLLLTGRGVRVGNLSILPRRVLASVGAAPELWSHYAAAVFKLRLQTATIPTSRGCRLAGASKMNFVALVIHGLTAISVFGEALGTRMLIVSSGMALLSLGGIVAVVGIRLFTDLAVPGWATYAVGMLVLLLMQAMMMSAMFIFAVLGSRQASTFLPVRDYRFFVSALETLPQTK